MNISGNTILITGGATGIGLSLVDAFIAAGNDVIICGRRKEKLDEAQKRFPKIHTKTCDVSQASDRAGLFRGQVLLSNTSTFWSITPASSGWSISRRARRIYSRGRTKWK